MNSKSIITKSSKEKINGPSDDQINSLINMYKSGQTSKTEKECRELLKKFQQSLIVINILGATLQRQGKLKEAVSIYEKAIQIKPDSADAYNNRGIALVELGELDKAVASYKQAIQIRPDYAEAFYNLGNALQELGQLNEAIQYYEKAIQIRPDSEEAYNNRGIVLVELGKPNEAIKSYEKAIKIKKDYAEAYSNCGIALQELRKLSEATENFRKAISIAPENEIIWDAFAHCLQAVRFTSCDESLVYDLLQILEQRTANPHRISRALISALQCYPKFKEIFEIYKSNINEEDIDYFTSQFSSIPLFLRVMELSTIKNLNIEKMLLQMRALMLTRAIEINNEAQGLPFYIAMSMQCFCNEYIYFESENEKQNIKLLQEEIKISLKKNDTISQTKIAILGAYRPLSSFEWANDLLKLKWSDDVKKIIVSQIENNIKEKTLRSEIPHLNIIDDKISQIVRKQYEENPYPRWINPGLSCKPKSIREVLNSNNIHHHLDEQNLSDKPDVLVAGCGTGRQALYAASQYLNSNVLAIDLSLNSLAYAMRKTKELGIKNIEYIQGDILKLNKLEKQFDIIESSGVLHHMDNPLEGWKVLVNKLCSGGVMKIGLYSDIARQDVVKAREYISKRKYQASQNDIRKFRKEIIDMKSNFNSTIFRVSESGDFYSLSSCRDLLFHAQEHRFTLPQIKKALEVLNLRFLGFQFSQPWIRKSFKNFYPDEDSLTSLSLWNQFELKNPNAFTGMYQFWVQKL